MDKTKLPEDETFLDVAGATERQREYHKAYLQSGSCAGAAKLLGIAHQNVYATLERLVLRAAERGWTEHGDMTRFVDPGQKIIGKSTLTKDEEGNTVWIKTKAEQENQRAAFKAFVDELCSGITPAKPKKYAGKEKLSKDLMPTIIIGDAHIGMKADGLLTRDRDFDVTIATKEIRESISTLVDLSPPSENALLVCVGDLVHSDSSHSTTHRGTPVDMDTRYERVMRAAAHTLIYAIETLLEKHKKVSVVIARGNHDWDTAVAIQLALECFFFKNNRVNIVEQKGAFHYVQWGKTLLGVNHGDKIRNEKLASIMPREMPTAWAETTHRYWLLGHYHHQTVQECDNGVICERFATLAPSDSWHSAQGYNSANAMTMIVYRREGGKMSVIQHEIPKTVHEVDAKIG
jgi:hypothetical protein